MNEKRYLEAAIRGWFPQEPYAIRTGVKVESETKSQQPAAIPTGYDLSATKIAGLTALFWGTLGSLLMIFLFSLERDVPLAFQSAWIIAGIAVGLVSGTIVIKNQTRRLSKDCQLNSNKKDLIILIVPLFLIFIFGECVSINFIELRSLALLGDLSAVLAFAIIVQVIRYGLFAAYEKRERVCLMQKVGGRIIVISKAANSA
jgi:hypothetical protein